MAAMEKITYQPLIEHLQQNTELYNQLYLDGELKYGIIDRHLLSKWVIHVVEPIVRETSKQQQESLPNVFKVFYIELLQLLGSGQATTFKTEYQQLWNLCNEIPSVVNHAPSKVLKALNSALHSVRTYQPSRTFTWIDLMNKTISSCASLDDLLNCGRMNAWFCGLAHLRDKCRELFPRLSQGLRKLLEENCPLHQSLEKVFSEVWADKSSPEFIGEVGGFVGFDGNFIQPPLLSDAGNYVLAADSENAYLLFADAFGNVLLPVDTKNLGAHNNLQSLKEFRKKYGSELAVYDDISSCIVKNNTVFITRHSSHYIFIYGWSNGD